MEDFSSAIFPDVERAKLDFGLDWPTNYSLAVGSLRKEMVTEVAFVFLAVAMTTEPLQSKGYIITVI